MLRNLAISTVLMRGRRFGCARGRVSLGRRPWRCALQRQWVPGSEVIKSSAKPPGSGGSRRLPAARPTRYPRARRLLPSRMTAAKAVKEDMAKVREQQCKEAKDRYEKAIQARRIYKAPALR